MTVLREFTLAQDSHYCMFPPPLNIISFLVPFIIVDSKDFKLSKHVSISVIFLWYRLKQYLLYYLMMLIFIHRFCFLCIDICIVIFETSLEFVQFIQHALFVIFNKNSLLKLNYLFLATDLFISLLYYLLVLFDRLGYLIQTFLTKDSGETINHNLRKYAESLARFDNKLSNIMEHVDKSHIYRKKEIEGIMKRFENYAVNDQEGVASKGTEAAMSNSAKIAVENHINLIKTFMSNGSSSELSNIQLRKYAESLLSFDNAMTTKIEDFDRIIARKQNEIKDLMSTLNSGVCDGIEKRTSNTELLNGDAGECVDSKINLLILEKKLDIVEAQNKILLQQLDEANSKLARIEQIIK